MEEINAKINAYLEKRDAERLDVRLKIRFSVMEKDDAERILVSGDYGDAFNSDDSEANKDAFTENISISGLKLKGDIRLVGGKALNESTYLLVEIEVPGAPVPVRTLAMVVWSDVGNTEPVTFYAGLFFVGINKEDVMKVARFLVQQRRGKQ